MRRDQRGMTLLSLLTVLAVVGSFAYIGMRVLPMYQEYYAVRTAMKGLASEPDSAGMNASKLEELFFRRLDINYADSVSKDHVKFERLRNGWRLNVNYEVRRPFIGNLDFVGKFSSSQDLTLGESK